jgi:transposase
MNNKYISRSRISEKKVREILRFFILDIEAKKVTHIPHISRPCGNQFVNKPSHINGIENLLWLCKFRLTRYRGIGKHRFYLHLKESGFRYNMRDKNIYDVVLKIIQHKPLKLF